MYMCVDGGRERKALHDVMSMHGGGGRRNWRNKLCIHVCLWMEREKHCMIICACMEEEEEEIGETSYAYMFAPLRR